MRKSKATKQSKSTEVLAGQLQLALAQAHSAQRSQAIKRGLRAKRGGSQ